MNSDLIKLGLNALYFTGLHNLMAQASRGVGVIFMLHHVLADSEHSFHPNKILEVTPESLDTVIEAVRVQGYDIVSIDEACRRLLVPGNEPPFACFTFDDAACDIKTTAYPVLKRNKCPFTVYVATAYAEGKGNAWWLVLEEIVRQASELDVELDGDLRHFSTRDAEEKDAAYNQIYWSLRRDAQRRQRARVLELADKTQIDVKEICRDKFMNWDELRQLAADPLVTIGAHSINHFALAQLEEQEARQEMARSAEIIGDKLGRYPRHFAYPYGDPASAGAREFRLAADLGFASALTTRKGVLFTEHAGHMTALPRVSLNGSYQSRRYIDLYLTGAPFMLWNRFRRLNVA